MKKILIVFLLIFISSNTSFASETKVESIGNSSGNINNSGFYVSNNEWIYFRSFSQSGGVYKVKNDGSEKTKIIDGFPAYINIVDNYLYYSDGWKLTKLKLDGSEKETLTNSAFHVNVVDGYIYYTNIGPQDGFIYKMKTDGTDKKKLSNDHVSQIVVSDNWIYYTSYYNKLIKVSVDGNSKTKLLSGKFINELNVKDNWLYFNYEKKLYKMKTDGTSLIKLSNDDARFLNVYGDWIYYCNYSKKQNIVRIKTDGTNREEINEIKSMYINIVDNFLFYHDFSKMVKIDLMDLETNIS